MAQAKTTSTNKNEKLLQPLQGGQEYVYDQNWFKRNFFLSLTGIPSLCTDIVLSPFHLISLIVNFSQEVSAR